jgi:hypothetical protein
MRVQEVAEFLTELPDGSVKGEGDVDFLVWPARPALQAIGEILAGLGCEVEPIESADFKGWELNFSYRGRRLWTRVTQIEKYVVFFADRNFWPKLIGRKHPLYLELLERFAEAFARDPRFSEVQWSVLAEFAPTFSEEVDPVG